MTGNKDFDKRVEFLDKIYQNLICKKSYKEQVDYAIYVCNYVKLWQEKYLYTPSSVPKQQVIIFDNIVSQYADKMYEYLEDLIDKALSSRKKSSVYELDLEKSAELIKLKFEMLHISARWKTLRVMQVFDLTREKNKMKVPRRLPLLVEPCFCFDRVIETALGIEHSDGFNPNRGVNCLPPSSGKTYNANCYTNLITMHFWLRYGESGLIRMTNNATNAQSYGEQCAKMLESDEWIKVFPEIKKYIKDGKLQIFKNRSAEKILLKDCNSECSDSIFMFGVDAGINGKRSQLGAVLDDLSNGVDDMDNDELHKKITDKVMSDVMDRSDDDNSPVIIQGTMYNPNDTQNAFIDNFKNKGLKKLKGYNFISVTEDGKCFTCLVDIEDENGNSIAPELYTNEKLQEKKNYFENRGKGYVYNLIYRQKRDSREPKTFALQFLNLYNWNDQKGKLSDYSKCEIDTTRKNGSDFFAMPIFRYNNKTQKYRLVDCIFEQKSLGLVNDSENKFATKVAKKIISSSVIDCCIENNTSNTTGTLLKDKCEKYGYRSCKFRERTTSKKGKSSSKVVRILSMEETIKNHIEFPNPNTIPIGHPLKLFMEHFTNWNSKEGQKKSNPDDACDSVAMFAEDNIFKSKKCGFIKEFRQNFSLW